MDGPRSLEMDTMTLSLESIPRGALRSSFREQHPVLAKARGDDLTGLFHFQAGGCIIPTRSGSGLRC